MDLSDDGKLVFRRLFLESAVKDLIHIPQTTSTPEQVASMRGYDVTFRFLVGEVGSGVSTCRVLYRTRQIGTPDLLTPSIELDNFLIGDINPL